MVSIANLAAAEGTMATGEMTRNQAQRQGSTLGGEADYSEIARRPLEADQCALIVVDIQEKLMPRIFEAERVVRNSQLLIRMANILGIPVMATVQYPRGLGHTVPEVASLLEGVKIHEKLEFGCFGNEAFCGAVKSLPPDRNTLLVCGLESHICVAQTVFGALNNGYLVHVASDAVSAGSDWNWKVGLERMQAAGAVISSTEMMMYELMRQSGTPEFKELLKYLKG
jgi:nicotinamidase-related amidase